MRRKTVLISFVASVVFLGAVAAYAVPGAQGPSSSQSPYLVRATSGIVTTSILTTGDSVGGYRMAGIPDGLGAFDNGDGTFTLLMNHEISSTLGVVRAHGGKGAFVSKWIIDKDTLAILHGEDLIKKVYQRKRCDWAVGADPEWLAAAEHQPAVFGRPP